MQPLANMPNVQWKVDNWDEMQDFIKDFEARCIPDGDRLLLQAWGGLDTVLEPGDCLVRRGDSIGIIRVPAKVDTAGPQDSISN
ncbi:MAG: hypothetical protein IIC63_06765 [Proteobacteria bacterium]|nr:hypothetical protein [Pseudomonadota bacterium]